MCTSTIGFVQTWNNQLKLWSEHSRISEFRPKYVLISCRKECFIRRTSISTGSDRLIVFTGFWTLLSSCHGWRRWHFTCTRANFRLKLSEQVRWYRTLSGCALFMTYNALRIVSTGIIYRLSNGREWVELAMLKNLAFEASSIHSRTDDNRYIIPREWILRALII